MCGPSPLLGMLHVGQILTSFRKNLTVSKGKKKKKGNVIVQEAAAFSCTTKQAETRQYNSANICLKNSVHEWLFNILQ